MTTFIVHIGSGDREELQRMDTFILHIGPGDREELQRMTTVIVQIGRGNRELQRMDAFIVQTSRRRNGGREEEVGSCIHSGIGLNVCRIIDCT